MEEKTSSYTKYSKAFYERHREKIMEKEKEKKRWLKYYADNKEKIAERRKEKRKMLKEKADAAVIPAPAPSPVPE